MQNVRSMAQFMQGNTMLSTIIHARGLKNYPPMKPPREIEYPERRKITIIPKTPQYPPNVRTFKMQKRLKLLRGPELIHNTLLHRQYGVMAVQGGRILSRHFDFIRLMIYRQRFNNDVFFVYRVDPPWQPISKKGEGQRLGGGKSAVHHYATPVRPGRIIFEIGGDCEYFEVEKALKAAAAALPFKAIPVSQELLDAKEKEEKELEENNKNPWTWKYMIQNNIGGCHKWIGPYDKFWFNKYI